MTGPVDHAVRALTGVLERRRRPFILCYHGVGSVGRSDDPHGLFVSRPAFVRQLDIIAEEGYELIGVHDLWRRMSRGEDVNGLGSISFDDGLMRTIDEAMPILAARGIVSSMYVPTGLLGRRHPDVSGGESIATAAQMRELFESGVEVGAHSVDHLRLPELPAAARHDQLRRSRAELEDIVGAPVTTMAYPFGAFDAETMRAARDEGFELACACAGAGPWEAMRIPREPVFPRTTIPRLRLKLAGLYGPVAELSVLRRRLLRR